jgi:hypothetical protein
MIVAPASFEGSRTVWNFEAEPGDRVVPQSALWIDGFIRQRSGGIETLWLALALGPYADKRIIVPGTATRPLCDRLEALLGIAVVAANGPVDRDISGRTYGATLIRDPLDVSIAGLLREPDHFAFGVAADTGQIGSASTASHIGCNAGVLRRSRQPLDRVGELVALWMLGPMLSLQRVTGFLCREELGGVSLDALMELAAEVGITLRLPFAGMSVPRLAHALMELALPPAACFRGLWDRYRMFPELMGPIFRGMRPRLGKDDPDNPILRICEYMAGSVSQKVTRNVNPGTDLDVAMFVMAKGHNAIDAQAL